MERFPVDDNKNLLPMELWKGAYYRELWNRVRSLADTEELAWDVFAEILGQTLFSRSIVTYPLWEAEHDDAPDADENIPWPFTEEDELRHRRALMLQSTTRANRQMLELDGQLELFERKGN